MREPNFSESQLQQATNTAFIQRLCTQYFRFKIPHSTRDSSGQFIDDYHQWERLKALGTLCINPMRPHLQPRG